MIALHNLRMAGTDAPLSFVLNGEVIDAAASADPGLDLEGALVFPGLINSHDHLDFNSFPALGQRRYRNYVEWGQTIHADCRTDIARVQKIPRRLRAQWGVYKNLLGGVTTVVHHGAPLDFPEAPLPLRVYGNGQSIHSIRLDPWWRLRLNNPLRRNDPCVIHIGEGVDAASREEAGRLLRWNGLRRPLIGVHGVSVSPRQAARFKAIVWCPVSNLFLLGKTAPVDVFSSLTSVVLGTDSTLTGSWDIWDHLRCARETGLVPDRDLFDMVTRTPAAVWGLSGGSLDLGKAADLTIARARTGVRGWDAFFSLGPEDIELVIRGGEIALADGRWKAGLEAAGQSFEGWSLIRVGRSSKYVPGDLPELARRIREYDPEARFPFNEHNVL
jgi:cytosine/adenosine deaminase-related metal-dependent hydrolase